MHARNWAAGLLPSAPQNRCFESQASPVWPETLMLPRTAQEGRDRYPLSSRLQLLAASFTTFARYTPASVVRACWQPVYTSAAMSGVVSVSAELKHDASAVKRSMRQRKHMHARKWAASGIQRCCRSAPQTVDDRVSYTKT